MTMGRAGFAVVIPLGRRLARREAGDGEGHETGRFDKLRTGGALRLGSRQAASTSSGQVDDRAWGTASL